VKNQAKRIKVEKFAFGELELSILKTVQKIGRTTVREVYEAFGSRGSYTTIMTVMSRLADKGELKREKAGKHYIYWSAEKDKTPSHSFLKRIKDKIFGGKPVALVSYLLETDQELSEEDLNEIERLIKKRRAEKKHG
jgi:predicted transcriptional regulator